MNNNYFKRCVFGFTLGVTLSLIIALITSLVIGNNDFYYVSNKLMCFFSNEVIAATIQIILSGLIGIALSFSVLCFKIDRWNLIQQFTIHFVTMLCSTIILILFTPVSFLELIILLVLSYFIIWNVQYYIYKSNVKKINNELSKINGINNDNVPKVNKKNKKLLILTYVILVLFIIYDVFNSNEGGFLKYSFIVIATIIMILESIRAIIDKSNRNSISIFIIPVVSVILLTLTVAINYDNFSEFCKSMIVKSTNLSDVYIDGLQVGTNIKELDKDAYTATEKYYSEEYDLIYEEIMISVDNDIIDKIYGRSGLVNISINKKESISNLDQVVNLLGNNYIKLKYDREQLLSQYIYIDRINDIKIRVVYREPIESNPNNELLYIIYSKN